MTRLLIVKSVVRFHNERQILEKTIESYQSVDQIRSHLDNVTNSLRLSERLEIVIERGKIAIHLIEELAMQADVDPAEVEGRKNDISDLILRRIQLILIRKVRGLLALQSKAPTFRGRIFLLDRLIAELEQSRLEIEELIPDHNIDDIVQQIRQVRQSIVMMNEGGENSY